MVVEEKPVQIEGDAGAESQSKKAAKKLAKEAAKAAKVESLIIFSVCLVINSFFAESRIQSRIHWSNRRRCWRRRSRPLRRQIRSISIDPIARETCRPHICRRLGIGRVRG